MELRRVLFRSPEVPDVAGDLRCRLGIDVPAGGEVAVEVSFDGGDDCRRQPATAADEALIQAFLTFAKDPTAGATAEVPFADEVALGLGREIHAAVARTQIADAALWSIHVDSFRAYVGPFSALDLAADSGEVAVLLGEHPHCASPPMPPPADLAGMRRVSVQPAARSIDSCIQWWTIDLFITPEGKIRSEEHTSELQSLMRISYAVFCLKKKIRNTVR